MIDTVSALTLPQAALRLTGGLTLSFLLAACGGTPAGQVEAHVNGQEVTERAVQTELAAANIANGDAATAHAALDKVIARALVVQEAQRTGVDKLPDYLAFKDRAEQLVLADMMVKRWAATMPPATPDAIERVVAANPFRFDRRALLQVDMIEAPATAVTSRDLAPLHSMDAIAALYAARQVTVHRVTQVIDTALIDPALARQLSGAPAGEPVLTMQSGSAQVMAVVQATPAPIAPDLRTPLATDMLRQTMIAQKLATLREGAKIAYRADLQPAQTARK